MLTHLAISQVATTLDLKKFYAESSFITEIIQFVEEA